MDEYPAILIELPYKLDPDRGFSGGTAAHRGTEFAEPDGMILAWIASHIRKPQPSALTSISAILVGIGALLSGAAFSVAVLLYVMS